MGAPKWSLFTYKYHSSCPRTNPSVVFILGWENSSKKAKNTRQNMPRKIWAVRQVGMGSKLAIYW